MLPLVPPSLPLRYPKAEGAFPDYVPSRIFQMKTSLVILTLFMAFAGPVFAHETAVGDLQIIHANIPQPGATARSAAGYMVIANDGTEADALIAIETPAAQKAMLHESATDAQGVATMTHIDRLPIPAGDAAVLEPGGFHIMLMGLTGAFTEGQMVPATLVFEKAGRVQIEFMIDPPGGADHSNH